MNTSTSAWSSGCESGWTGYLDESYLWPSNNNNNIACDYHHNNPTCKLNSTNRSENCQEEEDLSMVSDASSGPPHLLQDAHVKKKIIGDKRSKKTTALNKERKIKAKHHQQHSCYDNYDNNLDDTASSPALSYSQMYCSASYNQDSEKHFMGFSQNLSATHFEGNSAFSNQYGFWQSSHLQNADFAEPSHLRGRRWE